MKLILKTTVLLALLSGSTALAQFKDMPDSWINADAWAARPGWGKTGMTLTNIIATASDDQVIALSGRWHINADVTFGPSNLLWMAPGAYFDQTISRTLTFEDTPLVVQPPWQTNGLGGSLFSSIGVGAVVTGTVRTIWSDHANWPESTTIYYLEDAHGWGTNSSFQILRGDITGTVARASIAALAVSGDQIASWTIAQTNLMTNSVGRVQIEDRAVSTNEIAFEYGPVWYASPIVITNSGLVNPSHGQFSNTWSTVDLDWNATTAGLTNRAVIVEVALTVSESGAGSACTFEYLVRQESGSAEFTPCLANAQTASASLSAFASGQCVVGLAADNTFQVNPSPSSCDAGADTIRHVVTVVGYIP